MVLELVMQVIATLPTPNGNIVELVSDEGAYFTRIYVYEHDSDHELTAADAREFLAVVRSCGGRVHSNVSPRSAATERTP